jgi:subtilase family serine protease
MGSSWYLSAPVNFPIAWRPASGKINLVIKADGGNTIAESNESNNLSDSIWNIILP